MFGEIGLLCECDRTASVMTEAYTTSAYINKEQFRDLCEQYPEAAMSIKGGLKKYDDKNKQFKKSLIRNLDFTERLSDDTIEELSYGMKHMFVEESQFLFKEGDFNSRIYFLQDGKMQITAHIRGEYDVNIETLYRGCSIGAYCAIGKHAQAMTAEAKTPINLYYIETQYFEELAPYIPELKAKLLEMKEYCVNENMPMLDFRLFRLNRLKNAKKDIIFSVMLAVHRI